MGFLAKVMDAAYFGGSAYKKFTLLSQDISSDSVISDYVVEHGTSGNWSYRKWASGTFECWGKHSVTPSSSTATGSNYYSDSMSVSLPFTITSGVASIIAESSSLLWVSTPLVGTSTVSFRVMRSGAISTTRAISAHILIKGTI